MFTFLLKMHSIRRLILLSILHVAFVHTKPFISLSTLGSLEGSTTKTAWSKKVIYQFLGVPYAEAPSKNLRFKPPVPRSKWDGIKDAKKFGIPCPSLKTIQAPNGEGGDPEDCLNLSIYTKDLQAKNAVMVYIHGGSFITGSSAEFNPNYLLEKDIVLVVPQYRLGILGFLTTGTADIPGNMAILDIKLALEWVQQHITKFGGNPKRVTLFGQSAGAAIVSGLMISPAIPKTLFNRTIVQSATILAGWSSTVESRKEAQFICKKLACRNCERTEAIHKCLKETSVSKLVEVSSNEIDLMTFSITIEDYNNIFPTTPDLLAQNGTSYPMITGVTKHEGSFLLAMAYDFMKKINGNEKIPARRFIELLIWAVKERDPSGIIANMATKLFFKSKYLDRKDYSKMIPGLIDLAGMITIKSPVFRFAQLNTRHNANTNYLYTFDYKGEYTSFGYGSNTDQYPFNGGVHHSDENIYLFALHELNERDTKIAKIMIDLWTSFVINGSPETSSCPKWETFSGLSGPYLHINEKSSIGTDFIDEFFVTINDRSGSMIRST